MGQEVSRGEGVLCFHRTARKMNAPLPYVKIYFQSSPLCQTDLTFSHNTLSKFHFRQKKSKVTTCPTFVLLCVTSQIWQSSSSPATVQCTVLQLSIITAKHVDARFSSVCDQPDMGSRETCVNCSPFFSKNTSI